MSDENLEQIETSTETQEQNNQAQSVPPTAPTISTPHIDPLLQAAMRELHQQNQELTRQLATAQTATKEKATFDSFMADPEALIKKAIADQLAPVKDMMNQFGRQSAYDGLKSQFKKNPEYASLISQYEAEIDQMMGNADPTPQNFQAALVAAVGQAAISGKFNPNQGQQVTNKPFVPNSQNNQAVPPQARPTPPSAPQAKKEEVNRQLTESERNVMKIWGMNPNSEDDVKEYFSMLSDDFTLPNQPTGKAPK